jgi:glycosyl transferase, family 25
MDTGPAGVYGSFLSHVEILEAALRDGLETVWILEDDAIFSKKFQSLQASTAQHLRENKWDMFFVGHSVEKYLEFPDSQQAFTAFPGRSSGRAPTRCTGGSCRD